MKFVRLSGYMIVATAACLSVVSCGDEDDDTDVLPSKHIISMSCSTDNYFWKETLSYDDRGVLTGITSEDREEGAASVYGREISLFHTDCQIEEFQSDLAHTESICKKYKVENGKIIECNGKRYTYDEDEHLVAIGNEYAIIWQGENISKIIYNYGAGYVEITYEPSEVEFLKAPTNCYSYENLDGGWAWSAGFLGRAPRNAPRIEKCDNTLSSFSYQTDKEGFVLQMTCTSVDDMSSLSKEYKYTWD